MLVAVCGKSGVGKSSICRVLASRGFRVVSASSVAREMFQLAHGAVPTQRDLALFGLTILDSDLEGFFASKVIKLIDPTQNTAVDGLRSSLTIKRLREEFGAATALITRDSLSGQLDGGNEADIDGLISDVDSRLELPEIYFDFHVYNNTSVDEASARLLHALQQWSGDSPAYQSGN